MNRAMKLVNLILGGLLLLLVMYGIETSHADGRHHDDGDIDIGGTEIDIGGTTVDVGGNSLDIAGDRAYAVGGSSFDVDINQCLASKATNIVVVGWQTLKENPTCIADGLDARGNHVAAARVRCSSVKTIYQTFPDFEKCVTAVTMTAPPIPPTDTVRDHDEESHENEVRDLQLQMAVLIEEQRTAAVAANRYASRQRQEKEQDRLYAQQLIEQIQQIEEPPK